jgi:hypothetical protein
LPGDALDVLQLEIEDAVLVEELAGSGGVDGSELIGPRLEGGSHRARHFAGVLAILGFDRHDEIVVERGKGPAEVIEVLAELDVAGDHAARIGIDVERQGRNHQARRGQRDIDTITRAGWRAEKPAIAP